MILNHWCLNVSIYFFLGEDTVHMTVIIVCFVCAPMRALFLLFMVENHCKIILLKMSNTKSITEQKLLTTHKQVCELQSCHSMHFPV